MLEIVGRKSFELWTDGKVIALCSKIGIQGGAALPDSIKIAHLNCAGGIANKQELLKNLIKKEAIDVLAL